MIWAIRNMLNAPRKGGQRDGREEIPVPLRVLVVEPKSVLGESCDGRPPFSPSLRLGLAVSAVTAEMTEDERREKASSSCPDLNKQRADNSSARCLSEEKVELEEKEA